MTLEFGAAQFIIDHLNKKLREGGLLVEVINHIVSGTDIVMMRNDIPFSLPVPHDENGRQINIMEWIKMINEGRA